MIRIYIGCLLLMAIGAGDRTFAQQPVAVSGLEAEPEAYITGRDTDVCEGDSVAADIYFVGNGPYSAVVNNREGEYLVLTEVGSPTTVWLKPEVTDTFYVASVTDRTGKEGTGYGEVPVEVLEVTPVNIVIDREVFLKTDPGIPLRSNPQGGVFSGNGVSGGVFYPGIASPAGSPHAIACTFTNLLGCTSSDTVDLHVLHGTGNVALVSGTDTLDTVCDTAAGYEFRGSNLDGIPGLFEIRESGNAVPDGGAIEDPDSLDDRATFLPAGLSGSFELRYTYSFLDLEVSFTRQITVDDVSSVGIAGFPDLICRNDEPYFLEPDLQVDDPGAVYEISGPGVTGSQDGGFYYDPGSPAAPQGNNNITLEYTASSGCSAKKETVVRNNFVPEADFTFGPACLPDEGGEVTFENLSGGKYAAEEWSWDFGDPGSGDANASSLEEPVHTYAAPGVYPVSLSVVTSAGCVDTQEQEVALSGQPEADFTWLHDCYIKGEQISFVDRSRTEFAEMDTFIWTFRTSTGGILGVLGSSSSEDTVTFPFTSLNTYNVELRIRNNSGCADRISRQISLNPVWQVRGEGYAENFNGPSKVWMDKPADGISSWVLDEPVFAGFEPDPGDLAWYTDLPQGDTNQVERSWVESPCFDLGGTRRPLLQMDLMRSFLPGKGGAVLQYHEGKGGAWQTLGAPGEGSNWYNMDSLEFEPGESRAGWGLPVFRPDTGWVTAGHHLDMLAGNRHARLRIAVASSGRMDIGNQGFAFDNLRISDRTRTSVIEHFTNAASPDAPSADAKVDAFAMAHRKMVIDLQYHTEYPGTDPMNANNPYPPATRSFYYGVPQVPYAVWNGGSEPGHRFDFSGPSGVPNEEVLKSASAELPLFDMDLEHRWGEEELDVTVSVTCIAGSFDPHLQLYLAVMETSVTSYTGENQDTLFRNVVLDMVPSPAGTLLGNGWSEGETRIRNFSWPYSDYVEDREELAVVAFVQEREEVRILQATAGYMTPQTGTDHPSSVTEGLAVYPNPASTFLHVTSGRDPGMHGRIEILDLSGRPVRHLDTRPGHTHYLLDVSGLPPGMYVLRMMDSGGVKERTGLVVAR